MLKPHAEQLIARAAKKERLTAVERRHCVAYLQATQPGVTNVAMAELFGVSEAQIRQDTQKTRKDKAKLIKEDDIGLVIADIATNFDRQVEDLERSKRKCKEGTRTFLEHCRAIARLQVERIELLQALGFYPKNVGNMTVEKFEYVAVVDERTGAVDTKAEISPARQQRQLPAPEDDDDNVIEAEVEELDAEFTND